MTSRNRSRHGRDVPGDPSDLRGRPDPSDPPALPALPAPSGRPGATAGDHPGDHVLVRVRDLAGRPRGTGFVADRRGTVITSHEAVDGLPRLVLHAPGDRHRVVTADAVTPLPALGLALVRSGGLGVPPLPVTARAGVEAGTRVRIAAGRWHAARVLGTGAVTYTATDRCHRIDDVLELAVGTAGRDALRLGGAAAGGPVLDAATGAVLGVLGTALRSSGRDCGFAVPLPPRAPGSGDPLAELLAENAATVPAYGADLNLAGVLELTAAPAGRPEPPRHLARAVEPVERAAVTAEFAAFERGDAAVLGLVGPPGSGRTTQLAALAARRHGAGRPTLWLRGADLHGDDGSVADAARRALDRAARAVAAARAPFPAAPEELGDTGPERLARLARTAGRPLLLLLDGPEEMPAGLARRLAEWTDATGRWLRATGTRLVVACRTEYWEHAGAAFPAGRLHTAGSRPDGLPPCVGLGDLTPEEAREARARHGVPEGALADARHPLTLRMFSEVLAALAGDSGATDAADVPDVPVDRDTVFSAHLDLVCLRIAARLAAEDGLRGTAVRRLAAKAAGRVHEAARRSLGTGRGELDREAFEAVFPPGPAADRPGGGTGWAAAVLAEGLLVPAGTGYRFAHEEFADWMHGLHLDLDEALRALVHRRRTPPDPGCDPVPRHRVGPVVEALLLLARQHGTAPLASRLADLVHALDADPGSWWAVRLLTGSLARVPDATPYTDVLRMLADRIVARREQRRTVPRELGPAFWTGLALPLEARCALLRRLVHADGPPCESGPRFLAAAARLLAADPVAVLPYLVRWFEDERPLPATPHATVATAAQALLHTHRRAAPDALAEALADSAHRRADQLLAALAEEEPSTVCRAVGRWARDERPARRAAALTHGLRVAPHARAADDRALLRRAALALLDRTADRELHGGALALLVRDPGSRDRHLARALEHFAAGDPRFPPDALAGALTTHPEPVLDAFRTRLERAADADGTLRPLVAAATSRPARPVAARVPEAAARRPETAGHVTPYAGRCPGRDAAPAARAALRPPLTGLLDGGPQALRAALAGVLAAPGTPASRPLRRELLDVLLARESDPGVLETVLRAAARNTGPELRTLVHRTALLLVRTPEGAARLDRGLADLARHVPGFATAVAGWSAQAPREWAAVLGPGARRTIGDLAGADTPG